jgi:hypothetical protein
LAFACLLRIQPFSVRVPSYGIAYRGRPDFITDSLLAALRAEALSLRAEARLNFNQFISRVDTPDNSTVCEQLAASDDLYQLVSQYAGPCYKSYVTSYIYYDASGHCSRPHVDNAFTGITAMMGLRNDHFNGAIQTSASIVYWPDKSPMTYRLQPGELIIFFGVCSLHGRTPVADGEIIHSLLMSFRPAI